VLLPKVFVQKLKSLSLFPETDFLSTYFPGACKEDKGGYTVSTFEKMLANFENCLINSVKLITRATPKIIVSQLGSVRLNDLRFILKK